MYLAFDPGSASACESQYCDMSAMSTLANRFTSHPLYAVLRDAHRVVVLLWLQGEQHDMRIALPTLGHWNEKWPSLLDTATKPISLRIVLRRLELMHGLC